MPVNSPKIGESGVALIKTRSKGVKCVCVCIWQTNNMNMNQVGIFLDSHSNYFDSLTAVFIRLCNHLK